MLLQPAILIIHTRLLCQGAVESWLLRRGTAVLTIRKSFTCVAAVGTAVASLVYGAAQSPRQATVAMMLYFASHQFNNSGVQNADISFFQCQPSHILCVPTIFVFDRVFPELSVSLNYLTKHYRETLLLLPGNGAGVLQN